MSTLSTQKTARQFGQLHRQLPNGSATANALFDVYTNWVDRTTRHALDPYKAWKLLNDNFQGKAEPDPDQVRVRDLVPPDQVRVRDLVPGDRIKRGTDVVTVASIHHVRDANGEYWNVYHGKGSAFLVHRDGDYKYPRCMEPPTRLVKVSVLQPGDRLAVDELSQRVVTKVIRQEITTTADQKARVRYAIYVNSESLPAFDVPPDFKFEVYTES